MPVTSNVVPSVLASSVCWSLQCLIYTLTQGGGGGHFFRPTCSSRCGEGGTLHTNNTGMCSQCLSHTAPVCPPCPHCSGSRLLRREPFEASPGLHALPRSKPLRFTRSGSLVPFLGLSSSGDEVLGERGRCSLSPPPSLPLGFLGVQPAHLLRWMLTVQNQKKS